jgi:hypothetical protein
MARVITQLWAILAWISQGINCVFLFGSPDQTVSARAYVNRDKAVWRFVMSGLDAVFALFGQSDHCRKSHEADIAFAQYIVGLPE